MSNDDECPGAGKCHGCLKWCSTCENVKHVCDMRLRGDRCDEHPVPPTRESIVARRLTAQRKLFRASEEVRELEAELDELHDEEQARKAFDLQVAADERKVMGT